MICTANKLHEFISPNTDAKQIYDEYRGRDPSRQRHHPGLHARPQQHHHHPGSVVPSNTTHVFWPLPRLPSPGSRTPGVRSFVLPVIHQLRKCQEARTSRFPVPMGSINCTDLHLHQGIIVECFGGQS